MTDDPRQLVVAVARLLEGLGIPYAVGGSLASAAHGIPRTTFDADIVIALSRSQVEPLAAALEREFYVSREAVREALREHGSFNAIHLPSAVKVGFFILGTDAFDRTAFERRAPQALLEQEGAGVMVTTPEDIVLRKLLWYRMGGQVSEQQWRDVLGVLQVQEGRLEEAYLDRWAAHLGVSDLVERARREAAGG